MIFPPSAQGRPRLCENSPGTQGPDFLVLSQRQRGTGGSAAPAEVGFVFVRGGLLPVIPFVPSQLPLGQLFFRLPVHSYKKRTFGDGFRLAGKEQDGSFGRSSPCPGAQKQRARMVLAARETVAAAGAGRGGLGTSHPVRFVCEIGAQSTQEGRAPFAPLF